MGYPMLPLPGFFYIKEMGLGLYKMVSWYLGNMKIKVELPAQFNTFKTDRHVGLVYFHITVSDII